MNFAHQGGEDELPSNTMFAFDKALAAGADRLEIDVNLTQDGRLVVMHDTTLDRTTERHRSRDRADAGRDPALDAAYWFVPGTRASGRRRAVSAPRRPDRRRRPPRGFTRSDFRVPALEEVLRRYPRMPTNIEIKGDDRGSSCAPPSSSRRS